MYCHTWCGSYRIITASKGDTVYHPLHAIVPPRSITPVATLCTSADSCVSCPGPCQTGVVLSGTFQYFYRIYSYLSWCIYKPHESIQQIVFCQVDCHVFIKLEDGIALQSYKICIINNWILVISTMSISVTDSVETTFTGGQFLLFYK